MQYCVMLDRYISGIYIIEEALLQIGKYSAYGYVYICIDIWIVES